MNEHETHIQSNAERKAKIRERYKGIDREELEVIPAIKELSLQEDESEKRVGVYARVSTDDPNQTSSYELQKNHFQDMVNRHPGWKLVEIYADMKTPSLIQFNDLRCLAGRGGKLRGQGG